MSSNLQSHLLKTGLNCREDNEAMIELIDAASCEAMRTTGASRADACRRKCLSLRMVNTFILKPG